MSSQPSVAENGVHLVDRHVGRKVAERRMMLGFNQSDLGRALGLTFQQIQKYEKGSNRISASKLWMIAAFLKVDIASFFAGLGESVGPEDSAESEWPITRATVEIDRLAPALSLQRQKLVLSLVSHLARQPTEIGPVSGDPG